MTQVIDDNDLERFLEPLLPEWNRLSATDLRGLQEVPLREDTSAVVSYRTEERTPFGYEYVEFEISKPEAFTLNLRIAGRPGELSTAMYLPVFAVSGDEEACRKWLVGSARAGRPA